MTKKHQNPSRVDARAEINNLEKQIQDLKTGWQRTQADFLNFQKRVENEKLENMAYAKAEFMTKLTPVLDNFYRAFSQIKKNSEMTNGFRQIQKQLEDILKNEGLEKIPSDAGTKFDPNFHEAISYEQNSKPKDTIIDTYESGWQFQGKVLKPAKVRVSRGK